MLNDVVFFIFSPEVTGSKVVIWALVKGVDTPINAIDENVGVLAVG